MQILSDFFIFRLFFYLNLLKSTLLYSNVRNNKFDFLSIDQHVYIYLQKLSFRSINYKWFYRYWLEEKKSHNFLTIYDVQLNYKWHYI